MFCISEYESLPSFPDKSQGYVYIIENETSIKIGKSTNVYQRFLSLSNSNSGGQLFQRVYVSPSSYLYNTIERIMHDHYDAERKTGEWFINVNFDDAVEFLKKQFSSPNFQTANLERQKTLAERKQNAENPG